MTELTTTQEQAIRSRLNAATEGPWEQGGRSIEAGPPTYAEVVSVDVECMGHCYGGVGLGIQREADAQFMAHAREDIPALLAEVHRLRAELAKAREVTDEKVERAARALAAHWTDRHTNESLGRQKVLARHALYAALGGGDDA